MREFILTNGEPLNQQIYRYLRQNIVSCQIKPGTYLSEKEMSSNFNVSRQPVREAFIKLAETGLVQVLPQRGTFVRKISSKLVIEGRFIREVIETAIVRRAALEVTPEYLQLMEHNLSRQALTTSADQQQEFLILDDEFHLLISRAVDCQLAWETVENIKAAMDRVRFLTLNEVSPPSLLLVQHQAIVDAIKAHDPQAAEHAMRNHLQEMIRSIKIIEGQNSEWFESE
ncbi:GntR family transcriptional regulator [Sodalis sp. RH21]|uniref:GntR family transcriptional regulator n=1 Tax=unclassified Sodalis (in: enterobacteria) TaxID=2636512 RepID=UPI0039B65D15